MGRIYPILFYIFGRPVYAYGMLLAIAFVIGTAIARRESKRLGFSEDLILDLALWACIGAIIGARVLYVILEWQYYSRNLSEIISLRSGGLGGLSFHGGVLGGVLAGLVVARRYQANPWVLADLVAPILALGTAIARVGCLLNGCCYGYVTDLPWALPCAYGDDALRHPTQIYAVLGNLILFFVLWYRRDKVAYDGQLAVQYVMLYSILRFIVEIWRESQLLVGPLKTTQAASIVLIVAAWFWNHRLLRMKGDHAVRG